MANLQVLKASLAATYKASGSGWLFQAIKSTSAALDPATTDFNCPSALTFAFAYGDSLSAKIVIDDEGIVVDFNRRSCNCCFTDRKYWLRDVCIIPKRYQRASNRVEELSI